MSQAFEPLIKLLKSRIGRIIVVLGILSCLVIVVFDSLNMTKALIIPFFSCTTAFFLFGIGLLTVLPNDLPRELHLRWYILALIYALGGGLILLLFLYKLICGIILSIS